MKYTYKQRFDFLSAFRTDPTDRRIRFQLHAPDAMQLKWNVFDFQEKITVGLGVSAAEAVDHAIQRTNFHVTKIKTASTAQ